MGGMVNSLSRGRDGKDLMSYRVDIMALGDLAFSSVKSKGGDSTALVEQISDSPLSYRRDTVKIVPNQTKTNDSIMFNKAIKNVNDQKLRNFRNSINFLGEKW